MILTNLFGGVFGLQKWGNCRSSLPPLMRHDAIGELVEAMYLNAYKSPSAFFWANTKAWACPAGVNLYKRLRLIPSHCK